MPVKLSDIRKSMGNIDVKKIDEQFEEEKAPPVESEDDNNPFDLPFQQKSPSV
jgi:hypothetical protein